MPTNLINLAERRDALASDERHLKLVEQIARSIKRNLPPCFDLDDLVGEGAIALVDAAASYDPAAHGGAPFSAYARLRIRGAILESVRRKRYAEATRPTIDAAAAADGPQGDVLPAVAEALNRAATPATQDEIVDAAKLSRKLREAISWLTPDQRRVLRAYYNAKEPSLADVAQRLGQSKKRTLQLHAEAVEGIRARFRLVA